MPTKTKRRAPARNPKQPARRVRKALTKWVRAQNDQTAKKTARKNPRSSSSRRRRNPDELEAAAAMFESFHGKAASSVKEVTELTRRRDTLADLGRLLNIEVWPVDWEEPFQLSFKAVRLACSGDGGQLYLIGNQSIDLAAIGLAEDLPKDHVLIGECVAITYHTSKAFHSFEPTDYRHAFGEEGGSLPMLGYDVLSEKFYLVGGSYQVKPEGIVN